MLAPGPERRVLRARAAMAAVVYLTVKQGGQHLKEREDYDLRPDETFNQLIARAVDVPDGAEITARVYPDARHLLTLSTNVKDLGVPVAARAVHNPYICAIVTQPAPPPISEEEAEAKRKANAAQTLSLMQSAGTRMNKLPVKHDTDKKSCVPSIWRSTGWSTFWSARGLRFPIWSRTSQAEQDIVSHLNYPDFSPTSTATRINSRTPAALFLQNLPSKAVFGPSVVGARHTNYPALTCQNCDLTRATSLRQRRARLGGR